MTKEELAKKKGIKLPKEKQSPSDSIVTTKPSETAASGTKKLTKKENEEAESNASIPSKETVNEQTKNIEKTSEAPEIKENLLLNENTTNPVAQTNPIDLTPMTAQTLSAVSVQNTIVTEKRGPGKPRKRKDGDKKLSFWLDADLVNGLYSQLSYGESAGEKINDAIREYQKNHNTYAP